MAYCPFSLHRTLGLLHYLSIFIDRVAGQRRGPISPMGRRLAVIPESNQGAEQSIQDRKKLMIAYHDVTGYRIQR